MSIKSDLKTSIKAAFEARRGDEVNPEDSLDALATDLAAACAAAVKAAVEQQTFTHIIALANSAGAVAGTIETTAEVVVE